MGLRPQPRLRRPQLRREQQTSCRTSRDTPDCSSSTPTSRGAGTSSRPTRIPSTTRSRTSRSTSSRTESGRSCSRRSTTSRRQYQNYNSYDMFTPEYGDTVPSLLMGAAGMTYEKGSDENYGKQVYDHYLRDRHHDQPDLQRQAQPDAQRGSSSGRRPDSRAPSASCRRTSSSRRCTRRSSQQPEGRGLRVLLPARPARGRRRAADESPARGRRPRLHASTRTPPPTASTPTACRSARADSRRPAEGHAVDPDGAAAEALAAGDPRRGSVHPVQLLLRRRDLVVRPAARPRRRRPSDGAAAGRHADDRGRPESTSARSRRRRRTSTRSTPTRWRRSGSSSTCSTRASTSTAATAAFDADGVHYDSGCRARRRRLAGRAAASTSRALADETQHPGDGAEQLPGGAQAAGEAEDRPLHRQRLHPDEPARFDLGAVNNGTAAPSAANGRALTRPDGASARRCSCCRQEGPHPGVDAHPGHARPTSRPAC